MNTDLMFSSESVEWETPPEIFARLNKEHGFTLDVCATARNALCQRFYTKADNGLAMDWGINSCFMNPPYGRAIKAWMRKAYEESRKSAHVVCLVPARTDTVWWHEYAFKGEIEFLRGRLTFLENGMPRLDAQGRPMPAGFPSAIVTFSKRVARGLKYVVSGSEMIDDQPVTPIPTRCGRFRYGYVGPCSGIIRPSGGFNKCSMCDVSYGPTK